MELPLIAHRLGRWVTRSWPQAPGMWRLRHALADTRTVRFSRPLLDVELFDGTLLTIDPNDLIGRTIFYVGLWEEPVARHFTSALRIGDVVLDVGANLGQFSLLAARAVGKAGKVIAVEANPAMVQRLERNIRQNDASNVTVLEMAAWDAEARLWLDSGEQDNAGMAAVHEHAGDSGRKAVRARRLEDALSEIGVQTVDVVKIDIEGAELRALRGMGPILQNRPPRAIYCEIAVPTDHSVPAARELIALLESYGFCGRRIDADGEHPFRAEELQTGFLETLAFTRGET